MQLVILSKISVRTWSCGTVLFWDWWALWVTYGLENFFALSHAVTCSGFESKLSGTWLPDGRSTRKFGGCLLLAVIIINSSSLTWSITAAQKQDGSRRQNKSNYYISVIPRSDFFVFTHFCLFLVYPCWSSLHGSENQEVKSCNPAAHTGTNTVHEKTTIITKTGLSFISLVVDTFLPRSQKRKYVCENILHQKEKLHAAPAAGRWWTCVQHEYEHRNVGFWWGWKHCCTMCRVTTSE